MDRHWRVSFQTVLWEPTPDLIQRHTLILHSLSLMLNHAGMFQLDQLHATLPYRISAKTGSAPTPVVPHLSCFIPWPVVLLFLIWHLSLFLLLLSPSARANLEYPIQASPLQLRVRSLKQPAGLVLRFILTWLGVPASLGGTFAPRLFKHSLQPSFFRPYSIYA